MPFRIASFLLTVLPLAAPCAVWKHQAGDRALRAVIEQAAPGDTIVVHGEVREGTIVIGKPLTLLAAPGAVIDGGGEGDVLSIHADDVTVRGFILRGTRISNLEDHAAVKVRECRRTAILGNRIDRCFFAVHLSGVHDARIAGNVIRGQSGEEDNTANGIHLWKCTGVTVTGNLVSHHRDGIYLEFVTGSVINTNTALACERYGLHFMFSHRNEYRDNRFIGNGAGVAVMYSRDIAMHGNAFLSNRGASAYGLLLKDINDATITHNSFTDNTTGILVDGCNRVTCEHNTFRLNGWALRLYANAMYCAFRGNLFAGNTFDVGTNGSLANNTMEGNWWDRYTGYDLDRDGHGDVPHRPLGFYTLLVERMPHALVLSRSLFVSLLDRAERLLPSLSPEALKDDRPLMRPPHAAGAATSATRADLAAVRHP